MISTPTASRMVAAGLFIVDGWLEVAVEMVSAIDVGDAAATTAAGTVSVLRAESTPVPAGGDATHARQPCVQVAERILARAA
jgi:hypothetical protein